MKIRDSIRHNPKRSLRKTVVALREFGIYASRETVRKERILEGLVPLHRTKKPSLYPWQAQKRLNFCRGHRGFDWFSVASADEVEISIMGSINTHNQVYYGYPNDPVPPFRTFKFPISRRYFCAVTPYGAPEPIEITSMKLNRFMYMRLLDGALPRIAPFFGDREWWYQHDSAPYHASGDAQHYLESNVPLFFTAQEWPGNSPDIAPIENLFGIIAQQVAEAEPKNTHQLDRLFRKLWREATTPEKCYKLFASMPARVEAVIKANGYPTRY